MRVFCWGCGSGKNHYYTRRSRKKDPYLCPREITHMVNPTGPNPGYLIYACECVCIKPKKEQSS